MSTQPAARLSASWGNGGEVSVDLAVSKRNWSKIVRGDKISIRGNGYYYDGEYFRDYWAFVGGLDGELVISYGSKDGAVGDGFVGTPRQVLASAARDVRVR